MQTQNFHTHTWRCHHASGTEREYVENAIRMGMTHLGFSDHTPYIFEGDYYSTFRMRPEQLEDYVNTVLNLKKEYAKDISIHLGLEVEYYPKFFEKFLKLVEPYPIEYMLLGQHFLKNELDMPIGSGAKTDDEERLRLYVQQTGEALRTGRFSCFVHPDLLNFTGSTTFWEEQMRILCKNALDAGVPLEINMLGIRENRSYPREGFWKIAGETGNAVVIGSDAHSMDVVADPASYAFALTWVKKYGLDLHEAFYMLECPESRPNGGGKA